MSQNPNPNPKKSLPLRETEFLAGVFFRTQIPKSYRYLLHYFKSDLERQFLRYWFWAGNHDQFTEHTGYYCQPRWLRILKDRLDCVTALQKKTKSELSDAALSLLAKIERGKLSFNQIDSLLKEKPNEETGFRRDYPDDAHSIVSSGADLDT